MVSLRSKITQKVLDFFLLQQGTESYVSELARTIQVENGNLTRKLIELEKVKERKDVKKCIQERTEKSQTEGTNCPTESADDFKIHPF